MGKIEVVVVEARRLHDCQLIGIPDPYVRVTCDDKKYKTPVIKNNLCPQWNETFRFQIADEMSAQLVMEIWNKCTYEDDLMGRYQLSLGGLTRGVVKDEWYILDKSKTEAELRVRVLAVDFGKEPTAEQAWMVTTDIHRDPVLRAIEDGKWSHGRTAGPPPTPSGPPPSTLHYPGGNPIAVPIAGVTPPYTPSYGPPVTPASPPAAVPGVPITNGVYSAPAPMTPLPGGNGKLPGGGPSGYPPPPGFGGGYPPPPGYSSGYPPPPGYGSGYPPPPGFGVGYPPPPGFGGGYPPQPGFGGGYPPQPGFGGGYPPQPGYGEYSGGYPSQRYNRPY